MILGDKMTKKGYKTAILREEIYNEATKFIEEENRKAGYKKIRSLAHFIDMAIVEYIKKHEHSK